MKPIALIANPHSRANVGWKTCDFLLTGRDDILLYLMGEASLDSQISDAHKKGCETIIACGGDGTISSVVDSLLRQKIPAKLGIIPAGTLNHFAKDLRIPISPIEALRVIDGGHTVEIDVAMVNDIHFINNSSIGLYPYLVRARQALEEKGIQKWLALLQVIFGTIGRRFVYTVHFGAAENIAEKKVSSIFIGNNSYLIDGSRIGKRQSLTEGKLFVALLGTIHLLDMTRLFFKALNRTLLEDENINVIGLAECTIDSDKKKIYVAYDGEVTPMTPPLHYQILPKALKVIIPVR
jgi:diacylglycerol kinase family enzyme